MFTAAKIGNPSMNGQRKCDVYIHGKILFSDEKGMRMKKISWKKKRNKILMFQETQMELETHHVQWNEPDTERRLMHVLSHKRSKGKKCQSELQIVRTGHLGGQGYTHIYCDFSSNLPNDGKRILLKAWLLRDKKGSKISNLLKSGKSMLNDLRSQEW